MGTHVDQIWEQIRRYHLTTIPVVRKTIFGGNRVRARDTLHRLVKAGAFYRHEWLRERRHPWVYFSRREKPFWPEFLQRQYGLLWHCETRNLPLRGMSIQEKVNLLKLTVPAALRKQCALDQSAGTKRVAVVRVYSVPDPASLDLQRVVASLDRVVDSAQFGPWRLLLDVERLYVLVLVPAADKVAELRRWLQRRPPVCRIGGPARIVPAVVDEARRIP